MSAELECLRVRRRWWPAELFLRGLGLSAIYCCDLVGRFLHRMVTSQPAHQGTPGELATSLLVFLLLASGLALTLEGSGVFREAPVAASGATSPTRIDQ